VAPDDAAPRLLVTDVLGRRFIPLDKAVLTLGRRSESDVRVADSGVSRLHAEIHVNDAVCLIRDCGSKLGTYVNGERLTEHVLTHGDQIRLGENTDTSIVFLLGDEAPSQEQSAVAAATELRHMAGLLEGLRALGSSRVLEDVLTLVLDAAIEVTGAERGFIMLANDEQRLEFKLARVRGRVTPAGVTFDTSRKIPETVYSTGRATFVDDLLDTAMSVQHAGTVALGIRHVLCTPLMLMQFVERREERAEPRIIGVLYLDSREKGTLRSTATRTALDMLSSEAAVAIENARLYREAVERAKLEQELKVAAAIQQSLLPPGGRKGEFFTAAGSSVPCRAVGGDFFDYVDLPTGQFGFILGDVAGKGSPAALLAAAVLGMFSAEAGYQAHAASVLARLNQGLFRRRVEARFITTFYAMLARDGMLTYSNGGHNPPVLVTTDGIRRLETGGLVLGLFESATFEEEVVRLRPGDYVMAFSDGVTEAQNTAGEEYGDDRMLAALAGLAGAAPQALLDAVIADVRGFCGQALATDDVTAVVVRYDG
jgi:serine phosphatase RsbU (regulator of sigma subunit)